MSLIVAILIFLRPLNSGAINPNLDIALDILLFAACFISIIINKEAKRTPYDRAIILFVLSLLISCIFSQYRLNSIAQLYKYISSIFIFYFFLHEKKPDKFIIALIVSGLVLSLFSLFQHFVVSKYVLEYLLKQQNSDIFALEYFLKKRAFYPFVSPNLLAGYLVMVIAITAGFISEKLINKKNDFKLFLSFLSLIVAVFTLFLTKSVGACTSLLFASLLYFILRNKLTKKTVISFLVIFALFVTIVIIRYNAAKDFNGLVFSINKRLIYWNESLYVISQHFLTGVGLGNFTVAGSIFAHNSYLQFFAETGILGIVSFLWVVVMFIKKGIKKLKNREDYLRAGFFVGGSAFLIQNIVDFSFFITQVSFLWWMALGLILSEEK
jgi:putative inorganic carbon (hco3(-)) transporter